MAAAKKPRRPRKSSGAAAKPAPVETSQPARRGANKGLIVAIAAAVVVALLGEAFFVAKKKEAARLDLMRFGNLVPHGQCLGPAAFYGDQQGNLDFIDVVEVGKYRLRRFDSDLNLLGTYDPTKPDEMLKNPAAVTEDSSGNIYILEGDGSGIKVLSDKLKYERTIPIKPGQTTSMDMDSKGMIDVVYKNLNEIIPYGTDGTAGQAFGAPGSKSGELAAPSKLIVAPDGNDVVMESTAVGPRVKILSPAHKILRQFYIDPSLSNPCMGLDADGHLVFNDMPGQRGILVYDYKNGDLLCNENITQDNIDVISPGGIGSDKFTGAIYIHCGAGLMECRLVHHKEPAAKK